MKIVRWIISQMVIFHLLMKNHWIELKCMMWCKFSQLYNLQCIFHLNYLVNSKLYWILLHNSLFFPHTSYYGLYGWIIFVHSDFSLIPLLTNDFSLNHSNYHQFGTRWFCSQEVCILACNGADNPRVHTPQTDTALPLPPGRPTLLDTTRYGQQAGGTRNAFLFYYIYM